jgi:aspartyl-tRNA(Asn)/glutamyl-tRNA(Gln) amidotransferase subunit C
MTKFDRKTLRHLETLSRIECSEEDEETFVKNIQTILDYMDRLREVNTDNVKPLYQVAEGSYLPLREDVAGKTLDRQTFLNNAPASTGAMVRVPPVIS